jgi:S-DNA-T family DNA segregation ATPase FtsK/SpoIIIE
LARRIKDELIGLFSAFGGIFMGLSLFSYDKWDPSLFTFSTKTAANYGGAVGAYLADLAVTFFGLSSLAIPLFLLVYGVKRLLAMERHKVHLAGALLFLVAGSAISSLVVDSFSLKQGAGGLAGYYLFMLLVKGFSLMGAYMVALAILLSSLILLSPVSLIYFILRRRERRHEEDEGYVPEEIVSSSMPIVVEPPLEVVVPPSTADPESLAPEVDVGGYEMPRLDLLREYEPVRRLTEEDLRSGSELLESKLLDFSVKGSVTQVHTGPVVTMYEFEPAPGVKISRVVSLSDDLALALKAQSIRVATLAGKAAIGIEIPNLMRETVSLKDTISSEGFTKSDSKLTVALGKDIFGVPVVADLSRMPHLLVAGATGAGKSVALNCMVLSLLYKARPDEVKVLMIDPKLLEFSAYEGIPHLISPVVTNPKESAEMLRKMVFEMERRYRLIASRGVRNIESFNAASAPEARLPYVVIFIDELADLMFASASQVEDSIARLAQMARASGIHLVLATQRPSVDVITGVIKANFPARIAFQVTTRVDSRTIIDTQGAEQLVGKGDMLFMLPGLRIMRVHGTLVTEAEVRDVVRFVRAQGAPDFGMVQELNRVEAEAKAEKEYSEDRDETYQKAIDHAEAMGEVSISSIQRRLKVGYNKAARLMEMMEEDGLVGPPKGAGKPRDYLGKRNF